MNRPDLMVAREALEFHRPQITPCNVRSGYESLHHTGCQNLAAACLRGYPRRHDYVAPEEVFAFLDHLAGVEADPNLHRLWGALEVLRTSVVALNPRSGRFEVIEH